MRRQHSETDYLDGRGLQAHDNWFHHRNQTLDAEAEALPAGPAAYIRRLESLAQCIIF